jgi:hypothetical protein
MSLDQVADSVSDGLKSLYRSAYVIFFSLFSLFVFVRLCVI